MKNKFLEAGEIVNTHGIQGELKILPWCDGPEFLKEFKQFYINGIPYHVKSSRVHKTLLLAKLDGIDDVNEAMKFKGKTVYIDRDSASIADGRVFIADLIGLPVFSGDAQIGVLHEVLTGPANDVYVVHGEHEYMIPAVAEFLEDVNIDTGYIKVRLIPGMATDEN